MSLVGVAVERQDDEGKAAVKVEEGSGCFW